MAQASRTESGLVPRSEPGLIDAIPQLAWATDVAGRILQANPRWTQYAGTAPDTSLPLRHALDIHPEDAPGFDLRWASVLSSGEAFERTVRLRRRDGVYRWFLVLVVPQRDEAGGIAGWAGTATDIDDLQRAYRAADRLRLILDSVVEAIIVFDPTTFRIEEVNRGALELLGRSRDQLTGLSMDALLREGDVERLTAVVETLTGDRRGATTTMLDYLPANGGPISMEVVLQSVELPGGTRTILAIGRDIRDRIEAQVRLQRLAQAEHARAAELNAVIAAMGEAVVVCTIEGAITLTNPATDALFPGVEARTYDDILGQLADPDGAAPHLGEAGGPVELRTAGEPERWVELSTYPVASASTLAPTAAETIEMMRDVTQARRLEAVRQTFIGVLSHELRTPVTTIFGGAKLLARPNSNLDPETKLGIFRDIHDEAERLQRLVEDVVALNRFGEDAGEIGWEPVLIQRLLPRVVRSEDGRWPGVTFELDIETGLPTVSADPTYVEQVVRNLLSNAAKYGGIDSTVTIRAEAGEREVIVRVLDDGPGFPVEETDRLFELFYRSPGTATVAGGAGIGLFVCARLIRAMGGRIWARPRDSHGAEFGFALPELDE
ncbi:MAG: PAS domain S-box protein [Chloroflexi bacterium]|nr:PAS domain S-box protein [Chloroflexota bacterium]